jgi:hypothetical protein
MEVNNVRKIVARNLVEGGKLLVSQFALDEVDPSLLFEMTEVVGDRYFGIVWYGHAGARYFACLCGYRIGDVDPDWSAALRHFETACKGIPEPIKVSLLCLCSEGG